MPTLMACANGNSTDATTWAVCDATAELDSETTIGSLAASGTSTDGTSFTPGAITIDGIAVKFSSWSSLPTSGTFSVLLRNTTDSADVAGTTVTVAYSDLTFVGTTVGSVLGWTFFKFASPVTLTAGKAYAIKRTNSTNATINYWGSTATNTCRQLRTTTTQAPAAGDKLLVNREWTGSGASTTRTVTWTHTVASATAFPGTITNDATIGSLAWTNPSNAGANDGSYATATASTAVSTNWLKGLSCGFAVTATDVVVGVKCEVEWSSSASSKWQDSQLRLVKAGTIVTPNPTIAYASNGIPTTDTVWAYAGLGNTWSNSLLGSDVNSATFGVAVAVSHQGTTTDTVSVDYLKLTVYSATGFGAVVISDGGTVQFGTAASTDYCMCITGAAAGATSGSRGLEICPGGTFTMGTSGTRIPSTSTATLYMAVASAGAFGVVRRGTSVFRAYGAAKSTTWTRLTAAAAANATVLTVGDTTGWAAGDEIAIGGSNRSSSETEYRTILSVDSSTQITILQPLTTAKEGGNNSNGDPVGVPVANLSRNVRVCGVATTAISSITSTSTTTEVFDVDNVQFQYLGNAANVGILYTATNGTFSLSSSVVRDFALGSSIMVGLGSTTSAGTVDKCVLYGGVSSTGTLLSVSATSGVNTVTNNCIIGKSRSATGISLADVGSTVTGNLVTDCSSAFSLSEASGTIGTFSSNTGIYATVGLTTTGVSIGGAVASCVFARNNSLGYNANAGSGDNTQLKFSSCVFFGNGTAGASPAGSTVGSNVDFVSCTFYSEASYTQGNGIRYTGGAWAGVMVSCNFGSAGAHASGDISVGGASTGGYIRVVMYSTVLASPTEVAFQTVLSSHPACGLYSVNHDNVAGAMKGWKRNGTLSSDTAIYRTASPSQRLTPNTAGFKLNSINESAGLKPYVASGASVTCSVYVRCSATTAGDSATYNGNRPRLMLRRNPALGITDDTVIATATTASNGNWELLSGASPAATAAGVFEFYIDCDGTAGSVNYCDVSYS